MVVLPSVILWLISVAPLRMLDQKGFQLIVYYQEFRREGWTETAIILCKLNKSL